ncbi:IS30 family transposase, partial [Pseudodesulfovibrio sp. JC047]|uniref:IS30 family transposase n=1 Tax=Pseudodesulfovibrio sp. JC047 TaxID=2683199 RepID=UPI0013D1936C
MGHKQLNREKREIIERLLDQGSSIRKIASIMGYSASAISQEIARNSEYREGQLIYQSHAAQRKTAYRRKRYKMRTCKPKKVVDYVSEKLKEFWSPEQIHGRLMVDYPSDQSLRISFKTIYRWIERSKKGVSPLGKKVRYTKFLRFKRQRKYVRKKGAKPPGYRVLPSIAKRPAIAEKKIEFGHWEGDLVLGYKGIDNALTLVEMSTG